MIQYKKLSDVDLFILAANMGSCQCGDVWTMVAIDHSERTVTSSKCNHYPWKSGKLIKNFNNYEGATFIIDYVQEKIIVPEHYKHIIRRFTKLERALFDDGFTRLEESCKPYGYKRFAKYEDSTIIDSSEVY